MGHCNNNVLIIVGVIALVILLWCVFKKDKKSSYQAGTQKEIVKEGFTGLSAGALSNVGMLDVNNYDLLQGADGKNLPAPNFADLVDQGDILGEYMETKKEDPIEHPMERLQRIQGSSLMPRNSKSVTAYNIDVANPSSSMYKVTAPRVSSALKSKYKDYSQAGFIRGDIPISSFSNVCVVSKTHQGRDDLRMDGLFTPYYLSRFNKLIGKSNKNLVSQVSGAGVALDGSGAGGSTIMDSF